MSIEAKHQSEITGLDQEIKYLDMEREGLMTPIAENLTRVSLILEQNLGKKAISSNLDSTQPDKYSSQVRMDIIRAVSLYSQLRYDAEIIELRPESREPTVFGFKLHTFIVPAVGYLNERAKLLNPEDRTTSLERTNRKLREKYDEIFSNSRDFSHLIEDLDKYKQGIRKPHERVESPLEILQTVNNFDDTDWKNIVYNLRAVALVSNVEVLEAIITAKGSSK